MLAEGHGLSSRAAARFERLLEALASEPDPPTTIREPARAVDLHLADSLSGLAVGELRRAGRVADIGAGAGFPGLPLAIALPEAGFDLIEANARRCKVIARLAAATGIANAAAVNARVEEWAASPQPHGGRQAYDAATARALSELAVLAEYAAPLLVDHGVLVAWKGARDESEERRARQASAKLGLEVEDARPVRPFEGARSRHLYVLRKVAETPERFPRRPGMAAKRPLWKD